MTTERRQELQTNQLAEALAISIERVKPYSQLILAGILAVIVAIGLGFYFLSSSRATIELGYDRYYRALLSRDEAESIENLEIVATDLKGTEPGLRARLALASYQYSRGNNKLFDDRDAATQDLQEARENYQAVLADASEPEMKMAGHLGLARALETLNDLDGAKENYDAVVKIDPNSPYSQEASSRLHDLSKPSTVEFYSWLAEQEFAPKLEADPGIPGLRPDGNLDALDPNFGRITPPPAPSADEPPISLDPGLNPFGKEKEPKKTAPETPADAAATPQPSGDAPVTEEPASGEPATDAPVTETPATDAPATEPPAAE